MTTPIYKEAARLWKMGFAVHWLHSKSKRPIESGWGSGPRKPWDYLKETYNEGLNVGVRLGTPSKLANGFLAVVDVDVKSTDKKHRAEALRAAREILGPNADAAPVVVSGRGNGSRHYYVVTKEPFKTWNPAQSDEIVKVYMPSKRPSKKELASLTDKEIGEGMRLAPAWEVSLYSDGRQVVLPPSIHPDSGRPYQWARHLNGRLPLVEFPKPAAAPSELVVRDLSKEAVNDLKFTQVDLAWLPIADDVRDAIVEGKGVGDRSGYLLHASNALLSAGLSRDEVLSVLTDPKTFLGACAYDHAKTTSRARAAEWLWKYTLNKVMRDRDPSGVFTAPVEVKKLSEDEKKEQDAEFEAMHDWRADIIRTGPKGDGPPKACVENVVLILKNAVSEKIVRRDLFAMRDSYAVDTPWGGKNGAALTDDDVAKIKFWLGTRYRFEPNDKVIFDALVVIATDNAYDPVCDWIDALEPWDGKPRLGTWLRDNFEAEGAPEYLAQVFTKWVVAMIGRAKVPGLKFDWFPIFEGAQGMGKSSFGRLLVRDTYFLDWLPNLGDKDSALALQGMWGVELGELANMRKTEIEVVKAFITRTIDKIRPPYGKRWIESPRRCVFFGTTNRETYLTDDTGNRRIKPVKVGRLDFEKLRADRHQLFAEAVSIWNKVKANPRYFDLSGDAINFEAKIHAEKMVEDEATVMLESFQDFMQKVKRGDAEFDFKRFRILDLFGGVGPLSKWKLDNRHAQFAGKMLKKLGGEKRMIKGARYWKIDEGVGFSDDPDTPDFY